MSAQRANQPLVVPGVYEEVGESKQARQYKALLGNCYTDTFSACLITVNTREAQDSCQDERLSIGNGFVSDNASFDFRMLAGKTYVA